MSKTISNNSLILSNNIINSFFKKLDTKYSLIFLAILEGIFSRIDEKALNTFYNQSKKYLTIEELGEIFLRTPIRNDNGLAGVCFERFVYDTIVSKRKDITEFILTVLYKLDTLTFNHTTNQFYYSFTGEKKVSNEIDVILWADEKGKWVKDNKINLTLNYINDDDVILVKNELVNFKKVLSKISYNNNLYNNLGKADLFVKQKGHNLWHGVNVKKNIEDLKMTSPNYINLDIGIALTTQKLNYMEKNFIKDCFLNNNFAYIENKYAEKNKYIFAFPEDENFGNVLELYLNQFIYFLKNIVTVEPNTKNTNAFLAPLPPIFKFLYFNKKESIFKIMEWLDNSLKQDEIFLPQRIFLPNNEGTFLMNGKIIINSNTLPENKTSIFDEGSTI